MLKKQQLKFVFEKRNHRLPILLIGSSGTIFNWKSYFKAIWFYPVQYLGRKVKVGKCLKLWIFHVKEQPHSLREFVLVV